MKPQIPNDWIVATSLTHKNHIYYFNVKTNQTSWEIPTEEPQDAGTSQQGMKGKKRKKDDHDEDRSAARPTTPVLEAPKKAKGQERPMLKAKRTIPIVEERDPRRRTGASGSKDTPQMQQLREKMLQRQVQGNAVKKSKAPQVTPPRPSAKKVEEKAEKPAAAPLETQNLTPQMRVMLEKMKDRKSKGGTPKSPARNQVVKEDTKAGTLRRPRTRSLTPADTLVKPAGIQTRRNSRSIAPSPVVSSSIQNRKNKEDDAASSNQCSSEPTVVLSRLTPSALKEATKYSPNARKSVTQSVNKRFSVSGEEAKSPRLGRTGLRKKNLAAERLAALQRSFHEDSVEDEPSLNISQLSEDIEDPHKDSACPVKTFPTPPSIYKNAESRMKFLRDRIKNGSMYKNKMTRPFNVDSSMNEDFEADNSVSSTLNATNLFSEEMEWEPIEDEKIMQEIEVVRSHISAMDDAPIPNEIPEKSLDLTDGPSSSTQALYIVVDTNVFLSNVEAIEEARDTVFKIYGRPYIVVPWTVLRELDFIKDDRSMSRPESLKAKARRAVKFLHQNFTAHSKRILGQTPADVAKNKSLFEIDCPDDEILQTCLQIKSSNKSVVLLSYDRNLCNKAMFHDVPTLGRNDPLEKVDYLHASEAGLDCNSGLAKHLLGIEEDPESVPIHVKELRQAQEIFEEATSVLTDFLTMIVTKEMQSLYNENWEKYTIIRPPWNIYGVLRCAIKHWIAATSESFNRRDDYLLKQLLEAIQNAPDSGRKLSDVSHILECIMDLMQCAKGEKYPNKIAQSVRAIEILKAKCLTAARKLHEEKFNKAILLKETEMNETDRAKRAFQQFEEVYAFARDTCGLSSEAIGMPCSFPYKKTFPLPTVEEIRKMQPDVAANLNRLMLVLSTALDDLNDLHVNHRSVITLYDILANFKPDKHRQASADFSPLDVYYCLKNNENLLKSGLGQLQELGNQFCRMATFRCR